MTYINSENNICTYNIELNNYYNNPTKTVNKIECNYINNINIINKIIIIMLLLYIYKC